MTASDEWLKIRYVLPDEPEVLQVADTLQIEPETVVGHLVRLWAWAHMHVDASRSERDERHAASVMLGVTLSRIDSIVRRVGFASALLEVGWLEAIEGGFAAVPCWDRHNGKTAKRRALDARRASLMRAKTPSRPQRDERHAPSVTPSTSPSPSEKGVNGLGAGSELTREGGCKGGGSPPATSAFESWWAGYPRKVGKAEAKRAYAKCWYRVVSARPLTDPDEFLRESLASFARYLDATGRPLDKTPHGATWLNQDRWDADYDELAKQEASRPTQPRGTGLR